MTLFSVLCNLRILFIIYFVIKFDLINSCWRSGGEETSSSPLSLSGCADLFIQYGTPSIVEKQNQPTPTTTSTSCIPDGNLYCYPSGPNPPTPETFMLEDGFATSIPETDCKNFCACSEDGTCYIKTGQVDSVRIAPYCNLN
uniref:Uncharacterized protein n=1 Tax=Acrobeloides nanus TaxID=290746 RepID=A0A914EH05_9BILA